MSWLKTTIQASAVKKLRSRRQILADMTRERIRYEGEHVIISGYNGIEYTWPADTPDIEALAVAILFGDIDDEEETQA